MTAPDASAQEAPDAPLRAWPLLVVAIAASVALIGVDELVGPGWYPWVLIGAVAIAGGAIGVNDTVSLKLPNRYTGALAAAAGVQALGIAIVRHDWTVALWAAAAGAALLLVYIALGLLGWVGFGDAKFAAGLGVAAGTAVGLTALYIFPVALLVAGLWRLFDRRRARRPHGPALVIATVVVMIVGEWL